MTHRHVAVALAASLLASGVLGCSEASDSVARRTGLDPQTPATQTPVATREPGNQHRVFDSLGPPRLLGDSTSFARITSITHLDDRLLVTDRQTSPHLALVDLRTGEVVARAGRHGEGPSEFQDASDAVEDFRTPSRNDAWIYDGPTRRVTHVIVPASGDTMVLASPVRLRVDLPLERPVPLDSTWLSNGRFAELTLVEFRPDGTIVDEIAGRPPWQKADLGSYVGRRLLNRTFMDIHPRRSRVALVHQFDSRLAIFSTDGRYLVEARGPVKTSVSYRIVGDRFRWNDDNEMAYWGVDATDDLVFALFCGCTLESRRRPRELHVFTWDGRLEAVVPLGHGVLAIEVSRDGSTLWGAIETPYPLIAEWELPRLD